MQQTAVVPQPKPAPAHLSSLHDLLGFGVEVEVAPQGLKQHLRPDAHLLAVHVSKLPDTETQDDTGRQRWSPLQPSQVTVLPPFTGLHPPTPPRSPISVWTNASSRTAPLA